MLRVENRSAFIFSVGQVFFLNRYFIFWAFNAFIVTGQYEAGDEGK